MLTYICDHGDQYLTNILIDLDGQQLTVRMKRAANNGQVVVSLPSEILDPVSELESTSKCGVSCGTPPAKGATNV